MEIFISACSTIGIGDIEKKNVATVKAVLQESEDNCILLAESPPVFYYSKTLLLHVPVKRVPLVGGR